MIDDTYILFTKGINIQMLQGLFFVKQNVMYELWRNVKDAVSTVLDARAMISLPDAPELSLVNLCIQCRSAIICATYVHGGYFKVLLNK